MKTLNNPRIDIHSIERSTAMVKTSPPSRDSSGIESFINPWQLTRSGHKGVVQRHSPLIYHHHFECRPPSLNSFLLLLTMGKLPRNAFEYIPFQDVTITDSFWSKRIDATYKGTLPAVLEQLKITGRWDVFQLTWKPGDPNTPHIFWDRYP